MLYPTQEEVDKLNNMLSEAFYQKPQSFWYSRDLEGLWLYYMRVEAYEGTENDDEDPHGFSLNYFLILDDDREINLKEFLRKVWSSEDLERDYVVNDADGEWLGETFEKAETELKLWIDKLDKLEHFYN